MTRYGQLLLLAECLQVGLYLSMIEHQDLILFLQSVKLRFCSQIKLERTVKKAVENRDELTSHKATRK